MVIHLFFMKYVSNNLYTHTSNHAASVLAEVVGSILVQSNTRSNDISYSIFFHSPKKDLKQLLQDYIKKVKEREESINSGNTDTNQFYSKSITDQYPIYPL